MTISLCSATNDSADNKQWPTMAHDWAVFAKAIGLEDDDDLDVDEDEVDEELDDDEEEDEWDDEEEEDDDEKDEEEEEEDGGGLMGMRLTPETFGDLNAYNETVIHPQMSCQCQHALVTGKHPHWRGVAPKSCVLMWMGDDEKIYYETIDDPNCAG